MVGYDGMMGFCHEHIGKPVQMQFKDGTVMDGVIHEVHDDGIMFAPMGDGAIWMKGGKKGKTAHAIGDANNSSPRTKTVQFFFAPFFVPFAAIAAFSLAWWWW